MRRLFLILFLWPIWAIGQLPSLTSAWRIGAAGYEQGFEVSVDIPGHVVVAGYFEGTVDFDAGAGIQNRVSTGLHDIFLAKYTTTSTYEWAIRIGGAGYDQATGVDVDAAGNVFVSGYFTGNVDFDPGAGSFLLNAGSADDAFLAKFSPAGIFMWAIKVGGTGYDMSNNCSVDANGDVYLTGHFVGTVDFNPGAGTNNLVSAGSMDMYLAKYTTSGTYLWAIRVGAGSTFDESGYDIATFGSDVYVTGQFAGTVDFDPGAGTVTRTGMGGADVFLLKLNGSGIFQWVFTGGNAESDESTGVDVDALGNVYVAGGFGLTIDFDPGVGVANLTSAGVSDVFVAKYAAAGALIWAKRIGSINNQHSWGMAVSPDGNTFFTGFHQGTADFDPNAGSYMVASAGSFDSYLGSLDANGNFRFAFPIGAGNLDVGYGVDVNDACEVAITGYFDGTTDMDPQATSLNLTSAGGFDAYVGIYGACGPLDQREIELRAENVQNQGVELSWYSTFDDQWEYRFERSANLEEWETVQADYTNDHEAIDRKPLSCNLWYRIIATSIAGEIAVSNVSAVLLSAQLASLYPTVTQDLVFLFIPSAEANKGLQVFNSLGQLQWEGEVGSNYIQLSTAAFAPGTYLVRIPETGQTLRFVKL